VRGNAQRFLGSFDGVPFETVGGSALFQFGHRCQMALARWHAWLSKLRAEIAELSSERERFDRMIAAPAELKVR
jgi:hypothetical protein